MTVNEILVGLEQDGVRLALSPAGTVKARGEQAAITKWLPLLQRHKPGILAALQPPPAVPALHPTPPIQPGWQISWRDHFERLVGGWDEPELGTVAECAWNGSAWRVRLTTGTEVPLRRIVGVRKMRAGECVAAWTVTAHGLDGQGGRYR